MALTKAHNRMIEGSVVNVKDFGAVGDGVADDTAALQAAIDYAAPYVWQGSTLATTTSQQVVASVFVPVGKYRITSPLLLSKGLKMFGETGSGFFQSTNQSMISADFDGMDSYILDTAPFDTSGNRPLSKTYTGTQFDVRDISSVNSIVLENLLITAEAGRTVMGGLNMTGAAQSHVRNCGFTNVNVGIRLTGSWAGSFVDNHIDAKAQGIYCNQDVTTWDIQNNYITVTNNPDAGYVWPSGATGGAGGFSAGTQIINNYACILLKFSNPILKNNTLEGGNIGVAAESCFALNMYANYMEALKQWCYALNSNNTNIIGGYTFCSAARLLWASGSSAQSTVLDFSGVNQLVVLQDATSVGFIDTVTIKVNSGVNFLHSGRVSLTTPEHEKGINKIWLSSAGDDTYNGLNQTNAVLTLQEAFLRIRPGMKNEIIIPASETVATKYNLVSLGVNATNYFIPSTSLVVRSLGSGATRAIVNVGASFGQSHAMQFESGSLELENVVFNIAEASDANYRPFIRSKGHLSILAKSCDFVGISSSSAAFGARYAIAPTLSINTISCLFDTVHFIKEAIAFGGAGTVMWMENNDSSTFTSVTTDTSLKILSKQFP